MPEVSHESCVGVEVKLTKGGGGGKALQAKETACFEVGSLERAS